MKHDCISSVGPEKQGNLSKVASGWLTAQHSVCWLMPMPEQLLGPETWEREKYTLGLRN